MLVLDGKGRLTVPARWKALLDTNVNGQLVVSKNPDGCLSLFPLPVWEKFETELLSLSSEHDAWRRIFIGSATDVEIDSAARVLVPPELRLWAGFDRNVMFMGVGPNFELWDQARYEAREAVAIAQGRPEPLRNLVNR